MRDYQIAKQNVESFYEAQRTWDEKPTERKSGTAALAQEDSHQNEKWWLSLFYISGGCGNVSALTK